ncbi:MULTISPECIES: NO-inducible flavohemoprotein [unclassified Duganella]|uniref:NO-inducible flavohemoprotein n=1 Tax=unclassified Duganella TaxID=2636909 RepID=UPI000E356CA4|nr:MULTISPECIES: NO-inducible flavohemoprotein [unclassified Duganella]RFP13899.1 NO-inducible flavohemoprotein [Duganella sp. BJB475]RFP36712.1 NO-inducible flavohemoprotein [Duganella sp. BJB476]
MLSTEQKAIISATVPILEQGGEALTRHFYMTLFRDFPQVKPIFNQANQADGNQQRALANAVLMYAKNIDRLEQLGPLVSTIINKHVSLQIQREHYPMVGVSLLKAIREVLGADVATDAVLDAWGAAYGQLADILAGAEQGIYEKNEAAEGGWSGAREFKVVSKTAESDEVTSFVMQPADGGKVVAHAPGQYIGLLIDVYGEEQRRQYSLSAASNGSSYRISVKREPGGAVSNFLHDHVNVGDSLNLVPPSGDFTLADSDKPLVLISGGVGITPTLAMLTAALTTGRRIHFIHAARHASVHAFRDHIDTLAAQHPQLQRFYCYEAANDSGPQPHATGYIGQQQLNAWLPETRDVDAYFLGPTPFMKAIKSHLLELGVPQSQTYYEFFGPAEALG